jgi:hypothetical protein
MTMSSPELTLEELSKMGVRSIIAALNNAASPGPPCRAPFTTATKMSVRSSH